MASDKRSKRESESGGLREMKRARSRGSSLNLAILTSLVLSLDWLGLARLHNYPTMPVTRSAMAKLALTDPAQVDRSGTESLTSTLVSGSPPNSATLESDTGDHGATDKARKEDDGDAPATSSASDDDTSSDDDSDSETDSDDDGDVGSSVQLQSLLQKAKEAARERARKAKESKGKRGGDDDGLAGNEEMVLFGDVDEEEDEEEETDEEDRCVDFPPFPAPSMF